MTDRNNGRKAGKKLNLTIPTERASAPQDQLDARAAMLPSARSALSIAIAAGDVGEPSVNVLLNDLEKVCSAAASGDLTKLEMMLAAQAETLDVLFHRLLRRAFANMGEHLAATDVYMRLALKCQSQSRSAVEALGEIKNPRSVAFVRQADVAHQQQVFNNAAPAEASRSEGLSDQYAGTRVHAWESQNRPNKLLEHQHGERLDTGAAGAAGGTNSELEAVGAIHRPPDRVG